MSDPPYIEKRKEPHPYELYNYLHEELEKRDARIIQKLDKLAESYLDIDSKISKWEQSALIIRWVTMIAIGIITMSASVFEWTKEHLK